MVKFSHVKLWLSDCRSWNRPVVHALMEMWHVAQEGLWIMVVFIKGAKFFLLI